MTKKISGILIVCLMFATYTFAQDGYRVIPSPWAFSWGVGVGAMIPSGDLGKHFQTGFAADTEVSVYYQKAFLRVNGGFSPSKLSADIKVVDESGQKESIWPKGSGSMHASISANLGVNVFETDDICFYPFAGIGYGFIEPNLKTSNSDPLLTDLKINSLIWNLGFGVDYKFADKDYAPGKINRILKAGLRYQFQKPDYSKEAIGFGGATHWMTLRFEIGSSMPGKAVRM